MLDFIWVFGILVIPTTIWVLTDALSLSGRVDGRYHVGNQLPWVWVVGCLSLWTIFFPVYLVSRGHFLRQIEKL